MLQLGNRGVSRARTLNNKTSLSFQLALLFESQPSAESSQASSATQSPFLRPQTYRELTSLGFARERVTEKASKLYNAGAQSEQTSPLSFHSVIQTQPSSNHAAEAARGSARQQESQARTLAQQGSETSEKTSAKTLPGRTAVQMLRKRRIIARASEKQRKEELPEAEAEASLERFCSAALSLGTTPNQDPTFIHHSCLLREP